MTIFMSFCSEETSHSFFQLTLMVSLFEYFLANPKSISFTLVPVLSTHMMFSGFKSRWMI